MKKRGLSIVYPVSEGLPRNKARSIQIINTANALSSYATVFLLLGGERRGNEADILRYFSIKKNEDLKVLYLPSLRRSGRFRVSWNGVYNISCLLTILFIKRRYNIDLIFLRHLKLAYFLLKFRPLINLPIIFEAHEIFYITLKEELNNLNNKDSYKPHKIERLKSLEESVYTSVDGIVSISSSLMLMMKEVFSAKANINIKVAYDGVNIRPYKTKPVFESKIYYIGQLYSWKGVETAIKAIRFVPKGDLFIVGGNEHQIEGLKSLANALYVNDRICFLPHQPYSMMERYWYDADIFILPGTTNSISKYFTSPLKLFEYMAGGRPIVASNLPTICEILRHMDNAFLVTPDDPEDMAKGINFLVEHRDIAERLALNALKEVESYSWDRRADIIINFLNSTIKRD